MGGPAASTRMRRALLGFIRHLYFRGRRDGGVGVARGGVVCVQLSVSGVQRLKGGGHQPSTRACSATRATGPPSPPGRGPRRGPHSPGSWCGAELCRDVVAGRARQGGRCRWVSAARADVRTGWSRRCRCSPRTVPDPRPGPSRPSRRRGRPLPPKLPPTPCCRSLGARGLCHRLHSSLVGISV